MWCHCFREHIRLPRPQRLHYREQCAADRKSPGTTGAGSEPVVGAGLGEVTAFRPMTRYVWLQSGDMILQNKKANPCEVG